jgi:Kef-type K+ transport system membrane component KefB
VRIVWVLGLVAGLVAGAVVLYDVPLLVKLLVGLAVVVIGVAGRFGSVLLAGLLLGAGLLTFIVLLATSEPTAVGSALGVATLLIASGVAFSFRELFRDRTKAQVVPPTVAPDEDV